MSVMPHLPAFTSKSRVLTVTETNQFADALNAIRDNVMASLGQRDADYINRVLNIVRGSEVGGRGLLMFLGWLPPAWLAGVGLLTFSKIVENMEVGHNVMHGQYDWMNDPKFSGATYDWDHACAAPLWKHSHNYMHHTYTNIIGKDKDVGYGLIRVTPEQQWYWHDLFNLPKIAVQALLFDLAVAYHDVGVTNMEYSTHANISKDELDDMVSEKWQHFHAKLRRQIGKDFVFFPAIAGVNAIPVFTGNLAANALRNIWTFAVIFCGHFSADTEMFQQDESVMDNESKGEWYIRQIKGSGNITGSKFFHFMTGNLSHQIEHHLFPDMPANRYQEIAPKIQALCQQYGIHYNTGNFAKQFSEVLLRVGVFSLPNSVIDTGRQVLRITETVSQKVTRRLPQFISKRLA